MEHNEFVFHLQAKLCQVLGHAARLRIVNLLKDGALPVHAIVEVVNLTQPTVSRHLAILRSNGVLETRRKGSEIFYAITNAKIIGVCDLMREVLMEQEAHRAEMFNLPQDN